MKDKIKYGLRCWRWRYKYHQILIDLIRKKITWAEISHAMAVADVVSSLSSFQRVPLRKFTKLSPDSLERAITIHNRYTNGRKYQFTQVLRILKHLAEQLLNNRGNPSLLNTIVTGLKSSHPAFAIAARILERAREIERQNG